MKIVSCSSLLRIYIFRQSDHLIHDQQKIIQNLQQQLVHLQKRLNKIENEGIVEPSILFTRLDAERNEKTLQQAVSKGSMLETTYHVKLPRLCFQQKKKPEYFFSFLRN